MARQLTTVLRRVGAWPRPRRYGWPERLTDAAEVRRRVLAASGSPSSADAVADAWSELSALRQAAVLDPAGRLARAGRQTDATTCGSAVLAMLAATGDPTLAFWLVTGVLPDGAALPPELGGAPGAVLARLAGAPAERRFAALQRVLKRRSTAGALFGLPWPAALGTPPWGAARTARFPGVVYRHEPLDDTDRPALEDVLDAVAEAADAGVPVPLYSGGDTARGWQTAVPRHVVLVVGRTPRGFRVFEPASGRVLTASRAVLAAGDRPLPALGGWTHLAWTLLPQPA